MSVWSEQLPNAMLSSWARSPPIVDVARSSRTSKRSGAAGPAGSMPATRATTSSRICAWRTASRGISTDCSTARAALRAPISAGVERIR